MSNMGSYPVPTSYTSLKSALETVRIFCENPYNKTIQVNTNGQLEIVQKVTFVFFRTSPDYEAIGSRLKIEARAIKKTHLSSGEVRFYDEIAKELSQGNLYRVIDLIEQGPPSHQTNDIAVAVHAPVSQEAKNDDSENQIFEELIEAMVKEATETLSTKDRYYQPLGFYPSGDQKKYAIETFTRTFSSDQYIFSFDCGNYGQEKPCILVKKK